MSGRECANCGCPYINGTRCPGCFMDPKPYGVLPDWQRLQRAWNEGKRLRFWSNNNTSTKAPNV